MSSDTPAAAEFRFQQCVLSFSVARGGRFMVFMVFLLLCIPSLVSMLQRRKGCFSLLLLLLLCVKPLYSERGRSAPSIHNPSRGMMPDALTRLSIHLASTNVAPLGWFESSLPNVCSAYQFLMHFKSSL